VLAKELESHKLEGYIYIYTYICTHIHIWIYMYKYLQGACKRSRVFHTGRTYYVYIYIFTFFYIYIHISIYTGRRQKK